MSSSGKSPSRQRSRSRGNTEQHKLFVTNLDVTANEDELRSQLEKLFGKYGTVQDLSIKRAKKGDYKFAFVTYKIGDDADEAIRKQILNGVVVQGKSMKVELQDNGKRRKDSEVGCYTCGKKGHFARECRSGNRNGFERSRGNGWRQRERQRSRRLRSKSKDKSKSRSRSSSDDRGKKKRRRRDSSESSEDRRSRHKKDRRHSSRDKDEKRKKKHKRNKNRSSSSSRS